MPAWTDETASIDGYCGPSYNSTTKQGENIMGKVSISLFGKTDLGPAAVEIVKFVEQIYKPVGIVRETKAKEKAKTFKQAAKDERKALRDRGRERASTNQVREEINIEATLRKMLPLLNPDAKPTEIDPDWRAHFFDRVKDVSDDDMRTLWAKVVAVSQGGPLKLSLC